MLTDATMDEGGYWMAFSVRPAGERLAQLWLTNIRVRNTLPMGIRDKRQNRYKKSKPEKEKYIAMRGYVFAYVPHGEHFADFKRRTQNPSIVRPIGINGSLLSFKLKEDWEDHLDPEVLDPECVEPRPIMVGDPVVIAEEWGAFSGYTGKVDSIRKHEVALLLDGLTTALVKLPVNAVKKLAA